MMQKKSKPKKVQPSTPTEKALRKKLKEKELHITELRRLLNLSDEKIEALEREVSHQRWVAKSRGDAIDLAKEVIDAQALILKERDDLIEDLKQQLALPLC